MVESLFRTTDRILTINPSLEAAFLVVDPSRWVYQSWVSAAEAAAPAVKVFHAKSCAEAEAILLEAPCFHFSVSQELPDGNGLDFISNVKTIEPSAKAFFLGQVNLDQAEQERLGLLAIIAPPLPRPIAEALLARHFQSSRHQPGLTGSLSVMSVLDLVQLKCLQARPACLRIKTTEDQAYLYFSAAGLIHAHTTHLVGVNAFFETVRWTEGLFEELTPRSSVETTIDVPWQSLLLEAAHRYDTQSSGGHSA